MRKIVLKLHLQNGTISVEVPDLNLDYINIYISGRASLCDFRSLSEFFTRVLERIDRARSLHVDHVCILNLERVYARGSTLFMITKCMQCGRLVFIVAKRTHKGY